MSDLYGFAYTLDETLKTMEDVISTGNHDRMFLDTYYWLKTLKEYQEIGTVEECREAVEKLKRAEEALNVILSGNYNDECNFCVHHDNPMANCQCISGDGSWCFHNAKWNGRVSDNDNLEGMEE